MALAFLTAVCALRFFYASTLPSWAWMWILAAASFAGAKWITLAHASSRMPGCGIPKGQDGSRLGFQNTITLVLGYLFLWPGMNARAFLGRKTVSSPVRREWIGAALKLCIGAGLTVTAVTYVGQWPDLAAGWIGMVGIAMALHFGLFHLVSLGWRAKGVNAQPIMRMPGFATSLTRFWGGAWNVAFRDLMQEHAFKPLSRMIGTTRALFAVFVISGLLHEAVITVPAGAGYGLPTIYFLLQGGGVLAERTKAGRRFGLGNGARGWAFLMLIAALPAFILFPPVFVKIVIIPMLRSLQAL